MPAPQTNNHQSGFKRQNTVDSATIKENSARINARPASAQPKTTTENSEFIIIFFPQVAYNDEQGTEKIHRYISYY